METTQQQTFPIADARVITVATEPTRRSHPRVLLTLAGAGALGLALGLSAALLRERLERVFRTVADVAGVTGLEALGIVPRLDAERRPDVPLPARRAAPPGRALARDVGLARHVVEAPFSRMAEALRSVRVAIDARGLTQDMRVVGVTSALPREGKTLIAANLAQLLARSGRRTILIDADLREPSASRALAPGCAAGLIEVLAGRIDEAEAVWVDPATGLEVLPVAAGSPLPDSAELLSSRSMGDLLGRLRASRDAVVIDLPPILPIVDVRAVGHLVDGFVFVIRWGTTRHDAVRESLATADLVRQRLLGFVLDDAPQAALRRVEAYKGRYSGSYYSEPGG